MAGEVAGRGCQDQRCHAPLLHDLLFVAFESFRPFYTKGAFESTVVAENVIKKRIESGQYSVYTACWSGNQAGTVTTKQDYSGDLHFMSMAVLPAYVGKGLATALLQCMEAEAKALQCPQIILETYQPLTQAVRLYESCGFQATGKKRDYFGIEIFLMSKRVL